MSTVGTLFGIETELAFTALNRSGAALDRDLWLPRLFELVMRRQPYLFGANPLDIYLGNGSRLYVDCGRHPELSSPECDSPAQLLTWMRASEAMLAEAACDLEQSHREVAQVLLFKCNVDYVNTSATWGSHESYLHTVPLARELACQIIPHLATRVVYSGAGGLDPKSPAILFTLSPRVAHLDDVISGARAIFNTKQEPLARVGYHRLHVVSGESLCSHLADYLRVGTTALILKLIEAGLRPGAEVQLVEPLEAMRTYVADPRCSVRADVAGRKPMTAVDVQRHYLEQVERHSGERFMPPWARDVCRRWREVLDALARDPATLTTALDWPIKLAIFKERTRRRGFEWEALPAWNRLLDHLWQSLGLRQPSALAAAYLDSLQGKDCSLTKELESLVNQRPLPGLSLSEHLSAFHALRYELCEIDTRFGQLGPDGIFAALDRAGVLNHRIGTDEEIARAIEAPPGNGRAKLRGDQIRRLRSRRRSVSCSWNRIIDPRRRRLLDMSDPFRKTAKWRKLDEKAVAHLRLNDTLALRRFLTDTGAEPTDS